MRWHGAMLSWQIWPMKRGEVWWVEFDPSVGNEIRKTLPAVIVSNDGGNRNPARVVLVPLTSKTERLYPGEAFVTLSGKPGKAMADQIMAADKSRLKNLTDTLSKAEMTALETAILAGLGGNHGQEYAHT